MYIGFIVALFLAFILSYPPKLPLPVIQAYDYPIIRLLILSGVFYMSWTLPDVGIVFAIGYAILADDIVKTYQRKTNQESFSGGEFQMIHLLPGPSEVQDAHTFANQKVSVESIQDTIQHLQAQISELSSKSRVS